MRRLHEDEVVALGRRTRRTCPWHRRALRLEHGCLRAQARADGAVRQDLIDGQGSSDEGYRARASRTRSGNRPATQEGAQGSPEVNDLSNHKVKEKHSVLGLPSDPEKPATDDVTGLSKKGDTDVAERADSRKQARKVSGKDAGRMTRLAGESDARLCRVLASYVSPSSFPFHVVV